MTSDQAARDEIRSDLDTTLFVEAGAGSGKTTALVDRIVGLVRAGEALESIAAITFTDKAAAELRDRLRQRLEAWPDEPSCRAALHEVDAAAIGTLHSFAQRILAEHPIEARLPPRIEVLDEVSSGVAFHRRWATFRDALLADPARERPLLLLFASGVRPDALRVLAAAFDDNWDLVEERVPAVAPPVPDLGLLLDPALAQLDEAVALRRHCRLPGQDALWKKVEEVAAFAAALRASDDDVDRMERLGHASELKALGRGASKQWDCDIEDVKTAVKAALDHLNGVRETVATACAHQIGGAIREFTISAAEERRAAGQLEFQDLLVMARSLLRDPDRGPRVRRRLHQRYRRLLLDEFQDTDPIQIELAVRIAALDPAAAESGSARWEDLAVRAGQLFFVGDPKQSIYRFRRADISTFMLAQTRFGSQVGKLVQLTTNFRSAPSIIGWVNHVFGALIQASDGEVSSQPAYIALTAERRDPGVGPPVAVLGSRPHEESETADELRAHEASSVAAAIGRISAEAWSVGDDHRPARLGDITILVPARTSLPFLEDALEAAGIPFRAETSSLVYATRAVRDLLMVLRAVDDPTDHLRIVSALRTPLLGCGDDDLVRYKLRRGGAWGYLAPTPESVPEDDPVREALTYLRSLHDERQWLSPSELLSRIATERRAFELGIAEGRPRDVWRRLRFVIDQARAWSDATGASLRTYLRWVGQQTAEGARVAEAVLPETDDDAVRIMTIHGAKGLQFPITIVSGLTTVPQRRRAAAEVVFPAGGGVGYRFWGGVQTDEFAAWKPIDEQMGDDERVRLLYVAATRARDHLIVSLHRKGSARTNATLLADAMDLEGAVDVGSALTARSHPAPRPLAPIRPFAEWEAEREVLLANGRLRTTVAATALTVDGDRDTGLDKRPRDLDLPPWMKGRYGSAIGRAVHGVLQTIDLVTGEGLDALVAAQCQAEAVPARAALVSDLVSKALGSGVVQEAAASRHWREVYACTPVGGRMLEGYVDLLYRSPAGLVVVDYKTSGTSDAGELDRRLAAYRFQGASYALAVQETAGEPVVRVTFLFLTPDGPIEADLPALGRAIDDVRSVVAAGREAVTS